MDWKEEYKRKLVSAQDAVEHIKSGYRVVLGSLPEPTALFYALAARKEELENVELNIWATYTDCGWYDPEWEKNFHFKVRYASNLTRPLLDNRVADFLPTGMALEYKAQADERIDRKKFNVMLTSVSPPDRHGFCSWGSGIWNKKTISRCVDMIIAEVDERLIRTYGDNLIHMSEIDYFVEYTPDEPLAPFYAIEIEEGFKEVAQHVSTLIRDGDCIQIGSGALVCSLGKLGALDAKQDLGIHTEQTFPGVADLIKKGIITCKRKNLHPGKVVTTQIWPEQSELEYARENPMFELYEVSYVNHIGVIAANDNQVAMNEAIALDLTGQINSCSIGPRMYSAAGGQLEHQLGALFSKGGRAITVLPSTARRGTVSRIVPVFEEGTTITIPNMYADYVVTEYGIARLTEKSHRERAEELINIAHPKFRDELKRYAKKRFYP